MCITSNFPVITMELHRCEMYTHMWTELWITIGSVYLEINHHRRLPISSLEFANYPQLSTGL